MSNSSAVPLGDFSRTVRAAIIGNYYLGRKMVLTHGAIYQVDAIG
jgi:hypothetical protein